MSDEPSVKPVVCEEVFDDRSQPSEEEVRDYAKRIGIDPDLEPHLLPLARDGLMKPLPKYWKPVFDNNVERWYYFNFKTKQSSWEHPLDSKFRQLVKKNRSESISSAGEDDSKTSLKEELKSFEEAAGSSAGIPALPDSFVNSPTNRDIMDLSSRQARLTSATGSKRGSALAPLRKTPFDSIPQLPEQKQEKSSLLSRRLLPPNETSGRVGWRSDEFTPHQSSSLNPRSEQSSILFSENKLFRNSDLDDQSSLIDDDSDIPRKTLTHKIEQGSSRGGSKVSDEHDWDPNGSKRTSVIGRFTVDKVPKIDIDNKIQGLDSDRNSGVSLAVGHTRLMQGRSELTLSGGGSVFLKSHQKKNAVSSSGEVKHETAQKNSQSGAVGFDAQRNDASFMFEREISDTKREIFVEDDTRSELKRNMSRDDETTPSKSASVTRSILRTPQGERPLWDIDPQQMSSSEKALWRQQELEEEKKSVRFNLEKELNISFKLSDSSENDSDAEELGEEDGMEWNTEDEEDVEDIDGSGKEDHHIGERYKGKIGLPQSENFSKDTESVKAKKMSPLEEWAKSTWSREGQPENKSEDQLANKIKELFAHPYKEIRNTDDMDVTDVTFTSKNSVDDDFNVITTPTSDFNDITAVQPTELTITTSKENSEDFQCQHSDMAASKNLSKSGSQRVETFELPLSLDQELANALDDNVSFQVEKMPTLSLSSYTDHVKLPDQKEIEAESSKSNKIIVSESDYVTNLLNTVSKNLKSVVEPEGGSPRQSRERGQAREREQALRDWNVTQDSPDKLHRPPLSRQQSRQNIQQQMHQADRAADRDRALREWNVTGGASDIDGFLSQSRDANKLHAHKIEHMIESDSSKYKALISTSTKEPLEKDSGSIFKLVTKGGIQHEASAGSLFKEGEGDGPEGSDKEILSSEKEHHVSVNEWKNLPAEAANLEKEHQEHLQKLDQEYQKQFKRRLDELKEKLEIEEREVAQRLELEMREKHERREREIKEQTSRLEREAELRLQQLREQLEHKQKCAISELQEQHQQALAAQEVENQAAMLRVREQHALEMKALRDQLRREEEQVRREHSEKLTSIQEDRDGRRIKEATENSRTVEKLRCEKRLVEDKYRTLKEKYVKLKGEVKTAVDRKEQRDKGDQQERKEMSRPNEETSVSQTQSQSQSQTDRSTGTESRPKTLSSTLTSSGLGFQLQQFQPLVANRAQLLEPQHQPLDPPSPAPDNDNNSHILGDNNNSLINNDNPTTQTLGRSKLGGSVEKNNPHNGNGNGNGHVASQVMWWNNAQSKGKRITDNTHRPEVDRQSRRHLRQQQQQKQRAEDLTPLEALRRQLRTLDELEEQFPASSLTDTYLPYPFSDSGFSLELGSAELEFIRHRIHLERDLVQQAKNSLRAQRNDYQSRLHDLKLRQSSTSQATPSNTLHQMTQEEQELAEMEASLQRTRSLLGEKVIRLHHLENSLRHLTTSGTSGSSHNVGKNTAQNIAQGTTSSTRWAENVTKDFKTKPPRRWDWKVGAGLMGVEDVSDEMSSDSGGSSGFSSTEHASDSTLASLLSRTGGIKTGRVDDAADINTSLYNLNAEISEIWEVLCKQRAAAGLGPPPLLSSQPTTWLDLPPAMYRPSNTTAAVTSARTSAPIAPTNSSLVERTNSLRQWLQKAKMTAALSQPEPLMQHQPQLSL